MKRKGLIFVSLMLFSPFVFADYDAKCLADCFGTGHECKYCAMECYIDPSKVKEFNYPPNAPCDLESYYDINY